MKALSVRQPWAHAIVRLGKRVVTRDWWSCAYRGPVLLHAANTLVLRDFDDDLIKIRGILGRIRGKLGGINPAPPEELAVWSTARNVPRWRPAPGLPFGGIVGRARIVDVVLCGEIERGSVPRGWSAACAPWYTGGFALVLGDVEPLPFIPLSGRFGFFDVPEELVLKAIAEERRATALRIAQSLPIHNSWAERIELELEAGFTEQQILACIGGTTSGGLPVMWPSDIARSSIGFRGEP